MSGVSEKIVDISDYQIIIPMYGMVQSLNVSVATGVILYEAQRQRKKAGMYDKPSLSEEEKEEILRKWAFEDIIKQKKQESE